MNVELDHAHAPEFKFLRYEIEGPVATVTVRRPEALNALSSELLQELAEVPELVAENTEIRVLIFTGEGDKAFVAGADIEEIAAITDVFVAREFALLGQEVFSAIAASPVPTIAAINGYALGGGLELALACDIRVAAREAKLGLPEVGLGLIPGFGGTQRLPRLIGLGRALELILSGRHVRAEEAREMGLVNFVADDALAEAKKVAQRLLKNGPVAMALAKEAVYRGFDVPLPEALEIEADLFGLVSRTKDFKEGLDAFLNKRKPDFKGE